MPTPKTSRELSRLTRDVQKIRAFRKFATKHRDIPIGVDRGIDRALDILLTKIWYLRRSLKRASTKSKA
jgi:hypothetical protein